MILYAAYLLNIFYLKSIVVISGVITWLVSFLYIIFNFNSFVSITNKANSFYKKITLPLFLWFVLVILSPFAHGTDDFSYLRIIITSIGTLINLIVVLILSKKSRTYKSLLVSFMHIYIYAIVIYVFFTTLCLLIPEIRAFIIENVYISEGNLLSINLSKYSTRIGWAGFSGYSTSLKCLVANIFALYFIIDNYNNKQKHNYWYILFYLITLLGEFYYSRTGVIASSIILLTVFVVVYCKKNTINILWLISFFVVFLFSIPFVSDIALNNASVAWIFEPILNFFSDQDLSSSSSHMLNDMLFMPSMQQLVFGDGMYTDAYGYYMKTDLGFMRLILYFGIPGLILSYSLIYNSLLFVYRNVLSFMSGILAIMFMLAFIVFEFKGECYLFLFNILFIICVAAEYDNHTSKNFYNV